MTISVGIAGAGLLGRTLACELIEKGYDVTLFDRDSFVGERSCSYTGAGMLSPYCELDVSSKLVFSLGKDACSQWRDIVNSLPLPVFVQQNGTLVVAHAGDEVLLQQFMDRLKRKFSGSEPLERLTSSQLVAIEPALGSRFDLGYLARDEGQIDNRQLLDALGVKLSASDCRWFTDVEVLSTEETGCVLVFKRDGLRNSSEMLVSGVDSGRIGVTDFIERGETVRYCFDFVVDCRGMGAKLQLKNLRAVRGEIIVVQTQEVELDRPVRVLHPRYSIYVVPRPDQKFLIGATSIECEDYSEITVLSTLELLSAAFSLNPAFANARILESRVNCRPALPHNSPSIRVNNRLLEVNGLYRHGFLVTPSVVSAVIGFIEGNPCAPGFEDLFDIQHFRSYPQALETECTCN